MWRGELFVCGGGEDVGWMDCCFFCGFCAEANLETNLDGSLTEAHPRIRKFFDSSLTEECQFGLNS